MNINDCNKIYRINDLEKCHLENVKREKDALVVIDKKAYGIIESDVVETKDFNELIGAWCCLTPNRSTIKLDISVRVNGVFSKYFTYGEWRLGGDNLYYNQNDEFVEMSVDEILPKEQYKGNAFKFRVTLTEDAQLSLIAISYQVNKYDIKVEENLLKEDYEKVYSVPKLNQNMVPVIGHEMCSATTTAMLLKYKGMDFSKEDSEYEHRYVASLVADRGHNAPTFGNWVFNTAVMGGYGFNGYTYRVNNFTELKEIFDTVGPVGVSIRGETGLYHTGGHLMVACGYKIKDGKAYVCCNDPNVNQRFGENLFVYYEYPIEIFQAFFRGMCYVIE